MNKAGSSRPMWRAIVCSSQGWASARAASGKPTASLRRATRFQSGVLTSRRPRAGSRPARRRGGRRHRPAQARAPAHQEQRRIVRIAALSVRQHDVEDLQHAPQVARIAHRRETPDIRIRTEAPGMFGQHRWRVTQGVEAQREQPHAACQSARLDLRLQPRLACGACQTNGLASGTCIGSRDALNSACQAHRSASP